MVQRKTQKVVIIQAFFNKPAVQLMIFKPVKKKKQSGTMDCFLEHSIELLLLFNYLEHFTMD